MEQYLKDPKNYFKNFKIKSSKKIDRDHVMFPPEELLNMTAEEIEKKRPEWVGYYYWRYFKDNHASDENRKALAKVLAKKIKLDLSGKHAKRALPFIGDFRKLRLGMLLNDEPIYDSRHLTDLQIDRLTTDYIENDLDPKLLGEYQGDMYDNYSKFNLNKGWAVMRAVDKKKKNREQ